MTDHIPNDLSHLSDAEFNALCPQGEHAPGPEHLSPAAQAVLTSVTQQEYCLDPSDIPNEAGRIGRLAAKALRAVAHYLQRSSPWPNDAEGIGIDWATSEIHDIAAELEGAK
jgi:hypothetical protein